MGEAFLGIPNRYHMIGRTKGSVWGTLSLYDALQNEYDFDKNHPLSAYYGYRLSREYVSREGGKNFSMSGTLYSRAFEPSGGSTPDQITGYYDSDGKYNIGASMNRYRQIWAKEYRGGEFYGNASTSSKLKTARKIKITLTQKRERPYTAKGEESFDGSEDIEIDVSAPYLHLGDGGEVRGVVKLHNTTHISAVLPIINGGHNPNIGGPLVLSPTDETKVVSDDRFGTIYAKYFTGDLYGNARSASTSEKLTNARTISISARYSDGSVPANYKDESCSFDGTSDVNISIPLPFTSTKFGEYLPLSGGTVTGSLTSNGGIISNKISPTSETKFVTIGANPSDDGKMANLYVDDIACNVIVPSIVVESGQQWGMEVCHAESEKNNMTDWVNITAVKTSDTDGHYKYFQTGDKDDHGNGRLKCGVLKVNGSSVTSDIRLKTNVRTLPIKLSLHIISSTIPVHYNRDYEGNRDIHGFIAQQVKLTMLNHIESQRITNTDRHADDNTMSIDYIQYIPNLVNVCQYLLAKVDSLEVQCKIKDSLEFPYLQKEHTFDEAYYREHAEEIAMM